jgi:hypothetical protein
MIEDFGEKIEGAAKDRWQTYRNRLFGISNANILNHKLTEIFPEPNYKALLKDGAEPWQLATIRALRDTIPNKPTGRRVRSHVQWANLVISIRTFTDHVLSGQISREELEAKMHEVDSTGGLVLRKMAYEQLGHDKSLKAYQFQMQMRRPEGGSYRDEKQPHWVSQNRRERYAKIARSPEELIDDLKSHIASLSAQGRNATNAFRKFRIYCRKGQKGAFIGRKISSSAYIDIMAFDTIAEARKCYQERPDEILERYEQLKKMPSERNEMNRERTGNDWREGRDISPDKFLETFRFRGVQFGNYVEGPRRQEDLNRAYDAFMDLSEALGCEPHALSLGGRLGLAFGARGRGGIGAGVAHFEPVEFVINLTKAKGAGSLAHEWFHALDNAVMKDVGRDTSYATGLRSIVPSAETEEFSRLIQNIRQNSSLIVRSRNADKYRSSAYFSLPHEVGARSFEAWIIHRLGTDGVTNDYLANITPEEVYRAEAEALKHPEDRYVYPKADEIGHVAASFETLFRQDGPVSDFLGGTDMAKLGSKKADPCANFSPEPEANSPEPEAEKDKEQFSFDF